MKGEQPSPAQEKQTPTPTGVSREQCGFGGESGNPGGKTLSGFKHQAFVPEARDHPPPGTCRPEPHRSCLATDGSEGLNRYRNTERKVCFHKCEK